MKTLIIIFIILTGLNIMASLYVIFTEKKIEMKMIGIHTLIGWTCALILAVGKL